MQLEHRVNCYCLDLTSAQAIRAWTSRIPFSCKSMRTTRRVDSVVGKLKAENIEEPETISEFNSIEGFKRFPTKT